MNQIQTQDGAGGLGRLGDDDIDAWLAAAQPMAQLCYHRGVLAIHAGEELCARLQREQARGMLYLMQRKRVTPPPRQFVNGYDYLAFRSSRPWAPGTQVPRRSGPVTLADEAAKAVERQLAEAFR